MEVEGNPDHIKATAYFSRILSDARVPGMQDVNVIAIAHIVDSAIAFIPALDKHFALRAFLGKPSSMQENASGFLSAAVPKREHALNKEEFKKNPSAIFAEVLPEIDRAIDPQKRPRLILLDIGGYFAPLRADATRQLAELRDAVDALGYRLVGIIEDTENGHKRYERALAATSSEETLGFNVYSVARSPLKKPENHLVGVAVTFSIEAILRQSNIVLQSRRAGVIGFGPIGRSVAHSLRGRGIPVTICELDSIRLAQAAAQGFRVYDFRRQFEEFATTANLLVSATGAGASGDRGERPISEKTIGALRPGTFVASVTSADDEIDIQSLIAADYSPTPLRYNGDIAKWRQSSPRGTNGHEFYLMLGGNAVNFKHEGVIGPAIQLLQGEIAACLVKALEPAESVRYVLELNHEDRTRVADMWLDQYLTDSAWS
ncbi:hypothetical protein [Rathayibacter sp. AY1B5]|uniref:hypothetical protein n=1 Tax=Rathayibacter sp. AY1B5 TaxID=2080530 RepID=UPI0015E42100|nr:hypothetical protein [Rathayibacter sp. AY1B5]